MPETDNEHSLLPHSEETGEGSSIATGIVLRFRKPLIILTHIIMFATALMAAFLLTNNMHLNREWFIEKYPSMLLFILPVKLIIFGLFRQYRGWWRYVGISDLLGIAKASVISTLVIVMMWFGLLQVEALRTNMDLRGITGTGQGTIMLDLFTTIMLLGGLRMVVRLYNEEFLAETGVALKRFLIIGAGDAGEALLREMMRMKVQQYDIAGFLDDDPRKHGMSIHGITVLGRIDDLPAVCEKQRIEAVAIAIPSSSRQQLRHIVHLCQGTKVRFQTVPSITDIASGKLMVSQIRQVDINDLLGRDVVELDTDSIEESLKNKTILVTGAGGSIGSEMARQVCNFQPKLLLLLEQAENPLFFIERELRRKFENVPMEAVICNITDKGQVQNVFSKYKPQVVIHAAAHKHVPLMEANPSQAVKNNIIGTKTIANAADANGSKSFVMISTDKAVNPTSIMGSSKRVAEMYIQDLNTTSQTRFVTVRFGNVLGSNGSVVPIFKAQIARGGPVTVTHPEMTRYFMTIPEASQLVLQSATMGKGGEIFVLDMGEPVKIVDLASELITLSGFRPGEDIEISFSGMRPGEKLFEELSIEGEDMQPTRHPKIGIWKNIPKDRNTLLAEIDELVAIAEDGNYDRIVGQIKKLIPEYIGDITNNN